MSPRLRAVIDHLFDSIHTGDSVIVRGVLHEEAFIAHAGSHRGLNVGTIDGIVKAVSTRYDEVWYERIWDVCISIDRRGWRQPGKMINGGEPLSGTRIVFCHGNLDVGGTVRMIIGFIVGAIGEKQVLVRCPSIRWCNYRTSHSCAGTIDQGTLSRNI